MPFRDAELEMTVSNGVYSCGPTTVYYDPPPRTNTYTVHASRPYESLNGGSAFPDRPFSTGTVVIDGAARKATLTFASADTQTWHDDHFDHGRLVKIYMDLPGNLADEPLKIRLKCMTHATFFQKAAWFVTKIVSKLIYALKKPFRFIKLMLEREPMPLPPTELHPKTSEPQEEDPKKRGAA